MAVDIPLLIYWLPVVAGVLYPTTLGARIERALGLPSLVGRLRKADGPVVAMRPSHRMAVGLTLVMFGGFLLAGHSQWLYLKFAEESGTVPCVSAIAAFDCSAMADRDYNRLADTSWGTIGIMGFATLLFVAFSVALDPGGNNRVWLSVGLGLSVPAVVVAIYLFSIEAFVRPEGMCQYCVSLHLAAVLGLIMFWRARELDAREAISK